MKFKLFLGVATAAIAIATSVAAWAADQVRFGTNWLAQGGHGGYYQALADGTYAKYGLDVKILQGGPQVNNRPMLPAGKLDFLMAGNLLVTFDSVKSGIPIKVIAAPFQKDPQILMAHKGSYKSFADLANAPYVLIAKDAQFSFWLWLKAKYGFRDEQVRPYGFNLSAFLLDKKAVQQGFATSEPLFAKAQGADPEVYLLADQGWDGYSSTVETTTKLIQENPDLVQRFVDATTIGWYNYLYGDNTAGNAAIIAANPEESLDSLKKELEQIKALGIVDSGEAKKVGINALTPARVKSFYELAVSSGIIDKGALDIDQVADYRFVNKGVGLDLRKKLTGE